LIANTRSIQNDIDLKITSVKPP